MRPIKYQITLTDAKKAIHWQFTTADARIKLRSLYPDITLVTD
ncbi:hypothetical protein [Lentilactobacillus raoultii]|nr:hypothetical protein [Lentilactobacillus raoultii]